MKRIRLGQIGLGHNHGSEKMRAARKYPDVFEIVGIAERDERLLRERRDWDVYAGLPVLPEAELLARCDAALVETLVPDLTDAAARCVAAGLHLHMDKPAGTDFAAYDAMLADAERRGLTVQLGYMYRRNAGWLEILRRVRAGELGDVFAVDAEMSRAQGEEYREWLETFPGGGMFIFGCHLLDLVVALLGEPARVTPFLQRYQGAAVLEYPGAIATVSTASREWGGMERRRVVVRGTRGTLELRPIEPPALLLTRDDPSVANKDRVPAVEVPLAPMPGRYDEQLLEFARQVRGELPPPDYARERLLQRVLLDACGVGDGRYR